MDAALCLNSKYQKNLVQIFLSRLDNIRLATVRALFFGINLYLETLSGSEHERRDTEMKRQFNTVGGPRRTYIYSAPRSK
jgi:hypothetical protein